MKPKMMFEKEANMFDMFDKTPDQLTTGETIVFCCVITAVCCGPLVLAVAWDDIKGIFVKKKEGDEK